MASHIVEKAEKSGASDEQVKYLKRMAEIAEQEDNEVEEFFAEDFEGCGDPFCGCGGN